MARLARLNCAIACERIAGMNNVSKFFALLLGTLVSLLVLRWTGILVFDGRQILSTLIFSVFIYGTLLFGDFRLAFAFGGIALLFALNLLTVEGFVQSASLNVIVFLIGMFLVIGFLEENQFFESIVSSIIGWVGPRPKMLLLVLMIMATVSAALVDEVTSILFMTGTMLHLTSKYKLRPAPFIIMLVFATNIGSSASSIGNPIGVMIALKAGFSFVEFLRWSAPIALVVNVVTYLICRAWFATDVLAFEQAVAREHEAEQASLEQRRRAIAARERALAAAVGGGIVSEEEIDIPSTSTDDNPLGQEFYEASAVETMDDMDLRRTRQISWAVFIATIVLLITHGTTEKLLGSLLGAPNGRLNEGTMMIGASLLMGCVVLLLRGSRARELVERRVDWWTLSFFMMLFASVGTLDHTGVTTAIADRLIHGPGQSPFWMIQIVGWATGWLSAFLDNVLAVATFMPVVSRIRSAAPGPYPEAIYWMMLFGGTFMGNMTVIGSTANIIAVGVLEKRGFGTIKFGEWFKIGFIVSIASMLVATLLLGLETSWFSHPLLPRPLE